MRYKHKFHKGFNDYVTFLAGVPDLGGLNLTDFITKSVFKQSRDTNQTPVARLTYAASAWRGLTKAPDRKRIDSVLDRARRHGYCPPDLPTFDDLCNIADDELFGRAM